MASTLVTQLSYRSQQLIWDLAVYKSKLYGGTYSGAELFEWNGTNAWASVANSTGYDTELLLVFSVNNRLYAVMNPFKLLRWDDVSAWETIHIISVGDTRSAAMVEYDNHIYFAGWETGNLYRSDGISVIEGPFATLSSGVYVQTMLVFNNKIYAGTRDGRLMEWDGAANWVEKAPSTCEVITKLAIHKNELYACCVNPGKLVKWNGVDDWVQCASQYGSESLIQGFLSTANAIYAGTNPSALILKWATGDTVWTLVEPQLGTQSWIPVLKTFNNKIYAGTGMSAALYEIDTIPLLIADFSAVPTSGSPPLTTNFSDTTVGAPTSWLWDFGDGDTSTLQNPTHVYSDPGLYTVILTAYKGSESDTETKIDYIEVTEEVDFSAVPTHGFADLSVQFTDASVGSVTSWLWNFGDGHTSLYQNPLHVYTEAGTYTVSLTINGVLTKTKTNYINVELVASATATPDLSYLGILVDFTDTSVGTPTSWDWDFGDGSSHVTIQNPSHIYPSSGMYTVVFTASRGAKSDTYTFDLGVVSVNMVADFTVTPTEGPVDYDFTFTDTSLGEPTSWLWDFGDGETSTSQNPTHSYSAMGEYTVTLTASRGVFEDSHVDTVDVNLLSVDFTATIIRGLRVQFTDTSVGDVSSWDWNFGDGTTGTDQNPIHTFPTDGTYSVTLTINDILSITKTITVTRYEMTGPTIIFD
jgi:PKD repeat protein